MRIKITKRAEVLGGYPAATKEEYVPGSGGVLGHSIPVDYWLTGVLVQPIAIGRSVAVARETRNGAKCDGIFQSSPVTTLAANTFQTKNSIYDYEYIP